MSGRDCPTGVDGAVISPCGGGQKHGKERRARGGQHGAVRQPDRKRAEPSHAKGEQLTGLADVGVGAAAE